MRLQDPGSGVIIVQQPENEVVNDVEKEVENDVENEIDKQEILRGRKLRGG